MRAVIQRVLSGSVTINNEKISEIGRGYVVLLGVSVDDTEEDVEYMSDKIVNLRIFEDDDDKMNLTIGDKGGEILAVSQFTIYGDTRKGRRPSFIQAARPETAKALYELFMAKCIDKGIPTKAGIFQADMQVALVNDGPVTIIVDSKKIV